MYGRYMDRIMQQEHIHSVMRIMPPEAHGTSLDDTLLCFVLVDPHGRSASHGLCEAAQGSAGQISTVCTEGVCWLVQAKPCTYTSIMLLATLCCAVCAGTRLCLLTTLVPGRCWKG